MINQPVFNNHDEAFYKVPIFTVLDWQTQETKQLSPKYADVFNAEVLYPFQQYPYALIRGDTLLYTFPPFPTIYRHLISSDLPLESSQPTHKHIPEPFPGVPQSDFVKGKYNGHGESLYNKMDFFNPIGCYIRAAVDDPLVTAGRGKYLIFYSPTFETVHEERLPDNISPFNSFIAGNDFYMETLPSKLETEDTLYLWKMQLNARE